MRELHGVAFVGPPGIDLKHRALLFDKFHVWEFYDDEYVRTKESEAELDFLRSKNVVLDAPPVDVVGFADTLTVENFSKPFARDLSLRGDLTEDESVERTIMLTKNAMNRFQAAKISSTTDSDVVPLCEDFWPDGPIKTATAAEPIPILTIALKSIPAPDGSCAWQDIIDFKAEERDKLWAFRRWLHSLSSEHLTEAEIADEIDWSLSEYEKAMKIHHIKASQSVVDVFVITPLEILENLVKFNWSKIAKGALHVRKRKVELLEAELKAPGRECAYVFDARKRFGH